MLGAEEFGLASVPNRLYLMKCLVDNSEYELYWVISLPLVGDFVDNGPCCFCYLGRFLSRLRGARLEEDFAEIID